MTTAKRPEKKFWVGKLTDKQETTMEYRQAWNAACEAWEKYLKDASDELLKRELPILKLKACECNRDGARTVRKICEGISQCPRCGGLIATKVTELVPLDEDKLTEMLHWRFGGILDCAKEAKRICEIFGQPKASVPSVIDQVIDANYVDEVMTIEIGSVSDIKDFFNKHLEKVRSELHALLTSKRGGE